MIGNSGAKYTTKKLQIKNKLTLFSLTLSFAPTSLVSVIFCRYIFKRSVKLNIKLPSLLQLRNNFIVTVLRQARSFQKITVSISNIFWNMIEIDHWSVFESVSLSFSSYFFRLKEGLLMLSIFKQHSVKQMLTTHIIFCYQVWWPNYICTLCMLSNLYLMSFMYYYLDNRHNADITCSHSVYRARSSWIISPILTC